MNDCEKVELGLMQEEDTWYYKKMVGYLERVRNNEFGECCKFWKDFAGDGDGFKCFYAVVCNTKKQTAKVVKICESGVFEKSPSGYGWYQANLAETKQTCGSVVCPLCKDVV
jgi:hypothetical protein